MLELNLYGTLGCHLCEQAEQILTSSQSPRLFNVTVVEIADDDALLARYGVRIPVVHSKTTDQELGWPFDGNEFLTWLNQQF